MRQSFLERYGSWIGFTLVALFAWCLIFLGIHRSAEFSLLFPMAWIAHTPFGPLFQSLIAPYTLLSWWMWMEVAVTVLGWLVLYFLVRGVFYAILSMEGPSLWVLFAVCIAGALLAFAFILRPAFRQIGVWRSAWPGAEQVDSPR